MIIGYLYPWGILVKATLVKPPSPRLELGLALRPGFCYVVCFTIMLSFNYRSL